MNNESPKLSKEKAELFHTVVAQGLFVCKWAKPDISLAIAYLMTRVRDPNEDDWNKLVRMMKFLHQTADDVLTLSANDRMALNWYVDVSFAVHPDFKSHTSRFSAK